MSRLDSRLPDDIERVDEAIFESYVFVLQSMTFERN